MTRKQELELRASKLRSELNALAGKAELTTEERSRVDQASDELDSTEAALRAEIRSSANPDWQPAAQEATSAPTSAPSDTLAELRSKARIGRYLAAALSGRAVAGAEAELASELGANGIPLLLTEPTERRASQAATERRVDAPTPTPGTTGVNLQSVVPYVFSRSIAPRIGVDMPRVASGTYSVPRLTTALTAGAVTKGAARESSAGAFTSANATPKRISARLSITEEDLAAVGSADFEQALRMNLAMALSDELDQELLRGTGTAPSLQGLIGRFTAPTAATSVITFASFARLIASQVDGVWADRTSDLTLVVNPATYSKLASTFASNDDSVSASDRAMMVMRELIAHARMPASSNSNVATGLVVKLAMPEGDDGRRAVLPVWSDISIDDIYSDSASAIRHFSVHCICGDTLVLQPAAYSLVSIKSA